MPKYILNPKYGDMSVVVLGNSVNPILKKLKEHWEDVLEYPEDYDQDTVENVNKILNKKYSSPLVIMEDYDTLIDEDYTFEELEKIVFKKYLMYNIIKCN